MGSARATTWGSNAKIMLRAIRTATRKRRFMILSSFHEFLESALNLEEQDRSETLHFAARLGTMMLQISLSPLSCKEQ